IYLGDGNASRGVRVFWAGTGNLITYNRNLENQRTCVGLVKSSAGISLFVGGEQVGHADDVPTSVGNRSVSLFGRLDNSQRMAGTADVAYLLRRALSAQEFAQLHHDPYAAFRDPVAPVS